MRSEGPDGLTFANLAGRCGLSPATLVQRFGSKAKLKQSALLLAWDRLEGQTASLAETVPKTPAGAIELMVELSGQYGGIESYAEGLLLLREDLRDPMLRERGAKWKKTLSEAIETCFYGVVGVAPGIGLLAATHWQGSLLWWSFDPREDLEKYVEESLRSFVAAILTPR